MKITVYANNFKTLGDLERLARVAREAGADVDTHIVVAQNSIQFTRTVDTDEPQDAPLRSDDSNSRQHDNRHE